MIFLKLLLGLSELKTAPLLVGAVIISLSTV